VSALATSLAALLLLSAQNAPPEAESSILSEPRLGIVDATLAALSSADDDLTRIVSDLLAQTEPPKVSEAQSSTAATCCGQLTALRGSMLVATTDLGLLKRMKCAPDAAAVLDVAVMQLEAVEKKSSDVVAVLSKAQGFTRSQVIELACDQAKARIVPLSAAARSAIDGLRP